MIVRLRLFAAARERAGSEVLELDLPEEANVRHLREALVAEVPALADLASHLKFSVDAEYAEDSTPIQPTSDLACIPPVSGG